MLKVDHRLEILEWLSPPEHSFAHNLACDKRQPGTGDWFIQSPTFLEWQRTPSSCMWLYGKGSTNLGMLQPHIADFYP